MKTGMVIHITLLPIQAFLIYMKAGVEVNPGWEYIMIPSYFLVVFWIYLIIKQIVKNKKLYRLN